LVRTENKEIIKLTRGIAFRRQTLTFLAAIFAPLFAGVASLGPDQAPKEWKPSNRVQKIVDKNLKDDSTLKEEAGRLSKGKTIQGEG
jgi:hypothetical protein